MNLTRFLVPGKYENPLTVSGRGRTIAAFYLAQGDVNRLTDGEMRRDVLSALMSPRAVPGGNGFSVQDRKLDARCVCMMASVHPIRAKLRSTRRRIPAQRRAMSS